MIIAVSMEELLVECMEVLEGEGSTCEHKIYKVIQSGPLSSSAPNACGTTLLNDGGDSTYLIKT